VIELERHIEILLLSNDCVIVPNLGGFVAHNIEARYEEQEQLFLPPLRTLGFNPQLTINDSLLVQSYIEAYDISYPVALQRIEGEVEELKQHLQNEGSYELNDIGILALNEDGNYVFTPCEAGILTPTLYGLSSVEMARLDVQSQPTDVPATAKDEATHARIVDMSSLTPETEQDADDLDEAEENDVVRIKYTWIRNTVAIAAILLAAFILVLPTGKTEMMTRTISNINNGLFFGMMTEKDTNASKISISKIEERGARSENTQKADSEDKSVADLQDKSVADSAVVTSTNGNLTPHSTLHTPQKQFCIVLASYVSMRNSNAFIERLQKQGYDQAEIFERNNIRRVIYGHYASENDAYNDLRRFHRQSETAEAWVMSL
jgi:cell division septation protein DedD